MGAFMMVAEGGPTQHCLMMVMICASYGVTRLKSIGLQSE